MAQMIEVSGLDLVVGEEYYLEVFTWDKNYLPNRGQTAVFRTLKKSVVRYIGRRRGVTGTGSISSGSPLGKFDVVQHISGEPHYASELTLGLHAIQKDPPPMDIKFIHKFYRKTDTPMNEQRRTDLQKQRALAKIYEGHSYYEDDGTLVKKPGLPIDQYVSDDGVLHLGHAPPREGERARPTDPTYLPGGKRKYRRTRKSKKSRKGKSRKNRRKSNRRRR